MQIISSDKENLLTSSKLFFNNTSSDLISSKNIYIISDDVLTFLEVNLSTGSNFKLFTVDETSGQTIIEDKLALTISDADLIQQNNKYVYRIKCYFSTSLVGVFNDILSLKTDNVDIKLQLVGESTELDEKLLITLQNFRKTFNDDYLTAFFESNPRSNSIDFELYNRKIREFIMNSHDLLAMQGSYKNLFSALKFFGYDDLLDLREYWTNNNIYKSTSIANYVLNYIDKSLAGFKKTNKMSLVYQINEESGYDNDGLPLYTTIFNITDDIMLKMEALKRILEKDFLHFNTFIVDIIGEMQSVIGIEMNVIYNQAIIFNTHLTDNLYVDADKTLDEDLLKLKVRQVAVKNHLYKIENSVLVDNSEFIDYENAMFFEIDKIYSSSEDVLDDEYLLNYYQGVFAIIRMQIAIDTNRYQSFSYRLYNETELVYEKTSRNISEFSNNEILCGVKKSGKYKIEASFIDWYGGSTFVGVNDYFEIESSNNVLKLLTFNHENSTSRFSLSSSMKTYDSANLVPFQKVVQDFDINTYDQLQNLTNLQIQLNMSNNVDSYSTYCKVNELTSVPIKSLENVLVKNLGSTYMVGLIDIIGDLSMNGVRHLMIFDHTSNTYLTIEKMWTSGMNDKKWLMDFIQLINSSSTTLNIFNDFTYDLQLFGLEDNSTIEEKYFLRLRSKENSYKARFVDVGISIEYAYSKFPQQIELNDIHVFQYLHAISSAYVGTNSVTSDLEVIIDDVAYLFESITIGANLDLLNSLSSIDELYVIHDDVRDILYLTSNKTFTIKHSSVGVIHDVIRGEQFAKMYEFEHGKEFIFGETIVAEFDKVNMNDMYDVKFELYDEIQNKLLVEQTGNRLVYLAKLRTTYSIKVKYKIDNVEFDQYHSGCFLVR